MAIDNIKVFVLYCSGTGREISFFELVQGENAMDLDDYTPEEFWGVSGGMEIIINDHYSIFRSTDFYYVVKATNFLIHSLYWIQGKKCDRFDEDDDYPNDVVIRTTGNKEIRLARTGTENEVQLSFTPKEKLYNNDRGIRYFEGITINKSEWKNAVQLALDEYFEVLTRTIENNPEDKRNTVMLNYYDAWKEIRNAE